MIEKYKVYFFKKRNWYLQITFNEPYDERLLSASVGAAELVCLMGKRGNPNHTKQKVIISDFFLAYLIKYNCIFSKTLEDVFVLYQSSIYITNYVNHLHKTILKQHFFHRNVYNGLKK